MIGNVLGEGSYGKVHKAVSRTTKAERAVKSIPLRLLTKSHAADFEKEVGILKSMDHPNIVKLYETFWDKQNVYLVMEICSGGELFDRITEYGADGFTEGVAADYVRQILAALFYMHQRGVVHRPGRGR